MVSLAGDVGDLAVYLLVAVMVFTEHSALLRFVIPGEVAAVFGGVVASGTWEPRFDASVPLMVVVVMGAAIAADRVTYHEGHRHGSRTLGPRLLIGRRRRLLRVRRFLTTHARTASFLSRFTGFWRRTLPALAGISGLPYRRFLRWSAMGTALWSLLFVGLGTLAGGVARDVTRASAAGFLVTVVLLVAADATAAWRLRDGRDG